MSDSPIIEGLNADPMSMAEAAAAKDYGPGRRVGVMVPLPIGTSTGGRYDYWLPDHLLGAGAIAPRSIAPGSIAEGTYIEVPVGKRLLPAVIWDPSPDAMPGSSGRRVP